MLIVFFYFLYDIYFKNYYLCIIYKLSSDLLS